MSRGSIANIEAGRQRIPIHMLVVLARELDVPPADLIPDLAADPEGLVPPDRLEKLHQLDVTAVQKIVRRAREDQQGQDGPP
jgi:transcriptional regulator with XRE-family HTH domain